MKVEWRDFDKQKPNCRSEPIFVFKGKKVFVSSSCVPYEHDKTALWAPMELPDPPEKDLHYCFKKTMWGTFECTELNGKLKLIVAGVETSASHCPFCGFTLEKE